MRQKSLIGMCVFWGWLLITLACVRTQPQIVVITATFEPANLLTEVSIENNATSTPLDLSANEANETIVTDTPSIPLEYTVNPGDTLSTIASTYAVTVDAILTLNDLIDPNLISIGQIIKLPAPPPERTPSEILVTDTTFIRDKDAVEFDIDAFVTTVPGYIKYASDTVSISLPNGFRQDIVLSGSEIVARVASEFSIDPRLLLALIEFQSGWLTNPDATPEFLLYPMGEVDENRQGLYKQLSWAADRLNQGYYGWKYRDLSIIQFDNGERLLYSTNLNAGTVAIQYFFSQNNSYEVWTKHMGANGFKAVYDAWFENAVNGTLDMDISLTQPLLGFPFRQGEVWFYTGGPHGGWGGGSAWSAVDLAPPDERPNGSPACYISEYPAVAVSNGVIADIADGKVILDLDGDGNEGTGWSIMYLHLTTDEGLQVGQSVTVGDVIGFPSCEGGFSNATHLHIARRYNGEWIPAYCHNCDDQKIPTFTMNDWSIIGFENQEYQGLMSRNDEQRRAEQGRLIPDNRLSW